MSNVTPQPKIGFVSLGCPKNLVDSERILTELRTEGYDVVPSYDNADMVIVNTCGFIDDAKRESIETISKNIMPFVISMGIALLLITFIPALSLGLVQLLR